MNDSLQNRVSPEEWQARVDLAAAYRLVALYGWDDLIFTHISVKIPGTEHFLINPYGLMFEEITASSLVKINLAGEKISDSPYPVNPAGFTIHSCVHEARPDAQCVMHTHSINGVSVSAQKNGVLPLSQQSFFVLSSLAYHDYEGVALLEGEKPRLVRDLGDKRFLMLRNHGLLTVGTSVAEAFLGMYIFEATCMIQVRAQSGGGELVHIPQPILDMAPAQITQVTLGMGGALAWPALLRKLDRVNPGYRD
ncbi:MAG TPA: class II aldolase/adducin family protein [Fluviicoccus sp.]|nr:class II aldolase/adducin family protein [Fluviicoccus sp.]